jgi:S1-C subfamily serine protease
VRRIAGRLIRSGGAAQAGRAYLASTSQRCSPAEWPSERVAPGGPAARAGIRPGDVIVAVTGEQTPSADALASVVDSLRLGQRVDVELIDPQGRQATVSVTLGRQPGA